MEIDTIAPIYPITERDKSIKNCPTNEFVFDENDRIYLENDEIKEKSEQTRPAYYEFHCEPPKILLNSIKNLQIQHIANDLILSRYFCHLLYFYNEKYRHPYSLAEAYVINANIYKKLINLLDNSNKLSLKEKNNLSKLNEKIIKKLEAKFNKSLEQLAQELVFTPLHMNNTSFVWNKEMDNSPFACWYTSDGILYETEKFYEANAADNLLTTIEDYSKFMLYVLQGASLSDSLQQEMIADQVRVSSFKHFGLGWWIDENINEYGDFALVHGGDDIGVHCIAFILPHSKKGLVIFTNSDNGTDAFMEIINHYLEKDAEGIFNAETN